LKSLFQGCDVTIFAYGVTGTGKTHTMRGGLKLADRGVIPRLLSGIFRRGKKIMKDSEGETSVQVALSYYEIYNDKVFDLLEPPEMRTPMGLPLRAEANGKTVVAGLSERPCEDLRDFEKLYIEANNNRVTAATKLNAHSSRSHAILRVKLTQITGDYVRESTASAIDLAGSEDNRRTDNGKERLIESAAINKSLFVLSQCIDAIGRGDKRIPYRESKMTRILSLGQNQGITLMILNLAPLRSYHLDTLSSLNVSSRAKRIEVREIENEMVFKQVAKSNLGLAPSNIQRQPLRSLANAHNIHNGNVAAAAAKATDVTRPIKAFDVYTDKSKPAIASLPKPAATNASGPNRRSSMLRPPSDLSSILKPSKLARPALQPLSQMTTNTAATTQSSASQMKQSAVDNSPTVTMSAAQIEAMVEKKVSEILAARTEAQARQQTQPVQMQPELSDVAVQRRLEALERRFQNDQWREDGRSDGLRFLVAAKQHKEMGDDAGALKAYEMALPYFPGQVKLLGKIERLRTKLSVPAEPLSSSGASVAGRKRKSMFSTDMDNGDDTVADIFGESFGHGGGGGGAVKAKARRAKPSVPTIAVLHEEEEPPSPRPLERTYDGLLAA
jgi:hypothetical protein